VVRLNGRSAEKGYTSTIRSLNGRLRDEFLNMELFYSLSDARWTIENYRRYYNEERLHGALGYVRPLEFKEQWLAGHPDYHMGALPPNPRDLTLIASKQNLKEKPDSSFVPPGFCSDGQPTLRLRLRRALSSGWQKNCI